MSVHNNLLTNSDQSRLEDLLCDNTLAQLSSEEQNELNVLLGRATTDGEAEMASWELAAAAFEQQHAVLSAFTHARGQQPAGRTGPEDDGVELGVQC